MIYGVSYETIERALSTSIGFGLLFLCVRLIVWLVAELRLSARESSVRSANSEIKADEFQAMLTQEATSRAQLEATVTFLKSELEGYRRREAESAQQLFDLKTEVAMLKQRLIDLES